MRPSPTPPVRLIHAFINAPCRPAAGPIREVSQIPPGGGGEICTENCLSGSKKDDHPAAATAAALWAYKGKNALITFPVVAVVQSGAVRACNGIYAGRRPGPFVNRAGRTAGFLV